MKLKLLKSIFVFTISIILITGCSIKNPIIKKGANYGAVTGVILGGLAGYGLSDGHPSSGSASERIVGTLLLAAIVGVVGMGIGATLGYITDKAIGENEN